MSFNKFLTLLLLTVSIICFLQLTNCSPLAIASEDQFTSIGNNINRTDDNEKKVSCYVHTQGGRGISCVKW